MSPREAAQEVAQEFQGKGHAEMSAGDHDAAMVSLAVAASWMKFAAKVTDNHYHGDGEVWSPSDVDYP